MELFAPAIIGFIIACLLTHSQVKKRDRLIAQLQGKTKIEYLENEIEIDNTDYERCEQLEAEIEELQKQLEFYKEANQVLTVYKECSDLKEIYYKAISNFNFACGIKEVQECVPAGIKKDLEARLLNYTSFRAVAFTKLGCDQLVEFNKSAKDLEQKAWETHLDYFPNIDSDPTYSKIIEDLGKMLNDERSELSNYMKNVLPGINLNMTDRAEKYARENDTFDKIGYNWYAEFTTKLAGMN